MSPKPKNFKQNFKQNKGVSELAREAGVSIMTASRKLSAGKTRQQVIDEAAEWRAKQDRLKRRESNGGETLAELTLRKERALCEKYEIENRVKLGELVELAPVNAFVSGQIIRARDVLTRLPGEMSDRLAAESSPVRIRELLEAEMNRCLTQLSQYKGDAK